MDSTESSGLPEISLSLKDPVASQLAELQRRFPVDAEIIVLLQETPYRFQCRVHSSDINVVFDTFVGLYHVPPVPLPSAPVIVDRGANIGCTMVHYASLYPDSRIIGVELDAENVRLARINIAGSPNDLMLIHAAIWQNDGTVQYSGQEAWGFKVAAAGGRSVEAVSMPSLIARAGLTNIDFLKVDIEGGERELFEGELPWLEQVQSLSVEVHDNEPLIDRLIAQLQRKGFQAARDPHHWSAVIAARSVSTQ